MILLKSKRVRLVLIGFIAFLVLGRESVQAEFIWGTAVNLGPNINSTANDLGASISADGLTLYFSSNRTGGSGGYDLWCTTRATINDDWGPAVNLGQPPNSRYSYWDPSISSDGLTLYFSDGHSPTFGNLSPGGLGGQGDIWMVTRASVNGAWGEPINLGPAVNSQHAIHPSISSDSLSLYFQSHRPGALGHCDIMVATRNSTSDPFEDPVFIRKVNTGGPEWTPDISADGLTLFFMRNPGPPDIWASTRLTIEDDFRYPIRLPSQVNMPGYDNGIPNLSADGSTLYFLSNRPGGFGGWDLWQVSIKPIIDFNADGIVDSIDMCMMVDYWETDEPLYDIAPAPFGDSIVDVKDLIVLSEHLFEDYRLIAHWKLDEEIGNTAQDSVGDYNGTLHGESFWRPEGGVFDGALEFDGNGDYVSTPFILNPKEETFSVFAWIKGGAPEQVIIAQSNTPGSRSTIPGCTWLGINLFEGKLMTGLMDTFFGPLESDSVITDGQWHNIGLVYDRVLMKRQLYVDGVEVAADTDFIGGVQTTGGLYIGAGQALDADTFFSGLIDDVHIYNKALSAEEIAALAQ
jgi:Tol biopolymer transport system component